MATPQPPVVVLNAVFSTTASGDGQLQTTAVAGTPSKVVPPVNYTEYQIWGNVLAADGTHLTVIKVN